MAPQINRLCVPMAIAIPATGVGNLFFSARAYGEALPPAFIAIVLTKVGLLAVMALALMGASRAALTLQEQSRVAASEPPLKVNLRRIISWYAVIVGAGVVALGLGLWLSGI
jgi:hypothetical protein